jgi:hypothetical protein
MSDDEGFLSRWAKRKAEARHEPAPESAAPPPSPVVAEATPVAVAQPEQTGEPDMLRDAPPDEATREAWISKLEAIDLETLSYQDDFTVFLKGWVPKALRNRALRRLWRTSDVFEVLDGLNDYDEDYSVPAAAVGSIKSSWQPGRGFALADDKADTAAEVDAEAPGGEAPPPETVAEAEPEAAAEAADEAADEAAAGGDDSPADDLAAGPASEAVDEDSSDGKANT